MNKPALFRLRLARRYEHDGVTCITCVRLYRDGRLVALATDDTIASAIADVMRDVRRGRKTRRL